MPRQNVIQSNFTSGEVSPKISGRVDTKVYANGCKTVENMLVLPQGGVTRRGGTIHGDWARRNSTLVRIVPFRYSDTDAFQIELGDYYARVLRYGVPVLNSTSQFSAISAVATASGQCKITFTNNNRIGCSAADNGAGLIRVTTTLPHNLVNGDRCYFSGEFTAFLVTYISSTVVDLIGSTYAGPYASPYIVTSNLVSGSSSSSGLIKITTFSPHLLDTGDKIYMAHNSSGVDFSATPAVFDWVVTVVDDTSFTLDGSTYTAGSDTEDDFFVKWLRNGAKVTIDGTGGSQNLDGDWRVIQSTDRDIIVLANSTFVGATVGTYNIYFDPIDLASPWPDTVLNELTYRQSADVLYLMHPNYATRKLVRFSDNVWTLQTVDFKDGPYLGLQDAAPTLNTINPEDGTKFPDVYMQLSSYTHTALVTVNAGGTAFNTADDNLYIEYREGDQWRLAQLPGTVATNDTTATVTIIDNVLLHLDETVKFKNSFSGGGSLFLNARQRPYDPGAANASPSVPGAGTQRRVDPNNFLAGDQIGAGAGTLTSNYSNTFGVADVGKYVRYMDATAHAAAAGRVARWAQIVRIGATGASCSHSAAVTMASNNATGNFVISDEVRSATLTSYKNGATFGVFASTDVGRHIRLGFGGRWVWGKITAFSSTSVVTVNLYNDPPRDPHNAANLAGATVGAITIASSLVTGLASGRTYDWRLGAWSDTTGYPTVATFHEQRLVFGRTDTQPSTFWGSVTGDFENFQPSEYDSTVPDDNAFTFTLASGLVQAIKWMESATHLVIGTNSGEWIARSSSVNQEPITPSNITVVQQSTNGSAASHIIMPIRAENKILFVNRNHQKLIEVAYLFSEDRLEDKDLSVVSEHIFRTAGTVVETAYQQYPHGVAWFLMSDGTLAALTYNSDQEVIGWHRHEITDGTIESFCVTPNATGTGDVVHMIVNRTLGGVTKRMIESMAEQFYSDTATPSSRLGQRFLDSSAVVSSYAGTTISGLYHLEGKTVTVTGNGTKLTGGPYTVSSGAVAIGAAYSEVVIGLDFAPVLQALPIEGGSEFGVSQGMKKRVVEMKVRLYDSAEFEIYPEDGSGVTTLVTYNKSTASQQFFSGIVPAVPKLPYILDATWYMTTSKPYALTVLCVVNVVETNE